MEITKLLILRFPDYRISIAGDRCNYKNIIYFIANNIKYVYNLQEKLQEVSSSEDTQVLRPSLYPVLLLLARLYPSSLEGTVSNLKVIISVSSTLFQCIYCYNVDLLYNQLK